MLIKYLRSAIAHQVEKGRQLIDKEVFSKDYSKISVINRELITFFAEYLSFFNFIKHVFPEAHFKRRFMYNTNY